MAKGIIVDLDGTLYCMDWRRPYVSEKPKDWYSFLTMCEHDRVNPTLRKVIKATYDEGMKIILVSGRPWDLSGTGTVKALWRDNVPYTTLLMRQPQDYRPDTEIKDEIYRDIIRPMEIEIVRAFDDRPDIAEVWRSHGIEVTMVEAPDLDPIGAARVVR